jgi:cob(I)alamin adenosyltransferase
MKRSFTLKTGRDDDIIAYLGTQDNASAAIRKALRVQIKGDAHTQILQAMIELRDTIMQAIASRSVASADSSPDSDEAHSKLSSLGRW